MASQNVPDNKMHLSSEPAVSNQTLEQKREEQNRKVIEIPCIQSALSVPISSPSNVIIWGTVAKQPVKLLVDTGAAVTVISDNVYENVLRTHYSLLNNRTIDSGKTANGHVVFVHGFVSFPVGIGKND